MFLIKNGILYDAMPISKQTALLFFCFFLPEESVQAIEAKVGETEACLPNVTPLFLLLLKETVQIGGRRRQLEVCLPEVVVFFIFARGNCANRRKRSEISRRRQLEVCLPDVVVFFIFARGNCANRRKRSEISRRRQLEVRLPDVVVFLFLLEETVQIGGKEARYLADANWKSVYPT